ncbi:pentraxin fusion protein-like [Hemibagrus wyckioides]|uniref:pentraxin fusion protein-like n=1 Tax=Hemibagrus wyckioides TaxID=337641 RepID=UPI00266BAF4B|nr:pentraxin fusion protein-like [Hemibagrus wyckioides]
MENSLRPLLLFLGIYIFSRQWILTHQQVNVALRGIAIQSSTDGHLASVAIDGSRESNMVLYSCTHTFWENNPWWRVDLLAVYDICNVIVTNRGDCCSERINGAEIHIGNSLINNGNNNPRCVVISSISAGASVSYTCNMRGRYVNVFLPSASQILSLCEVEVYGVAVPVTKRAFLKLKFNSNEDLSNPTIMDKVLQKIKSAIVQSSVFKIRWTKEPEVEKMTFWPTSSKKMKTSQRPLLLILRISIFSLQWTLTHQQVNLALKGIATQSSAYGSYTAPLAIDGSRASIMLSHSCTHTNFENDPWWRVDLLAVYAIGNVIITNRGDCCPERINGAEIHIGNSLINNGNNNSRCAIITSISAGDSANYTCNTQGRYVNVFIPGVVRVLTLCEVEVYGATVAVYKRAFLKLKLNSSEDLSNPTMRDKALQKIKSANAQSPVFKIRWTKEPKLETKT